MLSQTVRQFLCSPKDWVKQREGMKYLQRRLAVAGVLAGVRDGVVKEEDVVKCIKKLTKMTDIEIEQEIRGILLEQEESV